MERVGIFLLFFMVAFQLKATIYYVSPYGDDSNAGNSTSEAFLTLAKAVGKCSSGDDIFLLEGTYHCSSRIRLNISGTADDWCSIQNYSDGKVVLDFSEMETGDSNQGILLNGDYWLIKGITIKAAGDNGLLIDGGAYNRIENCVFTENRDSGCQLKNKAAYNSIINCDSYFNYDPSGNGEDADGFAPKLSIGEGNYFYGCRAFDNSDDGWDMYGSTETVVLRDCWSFSNGYNYWDDSDFQGDGNAFKVGGNYAAASHFVYRCVAFYNKGKGFDQNHNMGEVTLINNTAYQNEGKDFQFYESPDSVPGGYHTAKNNICYPVDINFADGSLLVNNSWNLSSISVSDDDFISVDTTGVRGVRQSDGSLPELDFLHLTTGSEMIDAGVVDDSISYNGAAPDLGAFETSSSSTGSFIVERDETENNFNVKLLKNPFSSELNFQVLDVDPDVKTLIVRVTSLNGQIVTTRIVGVYRNSDLITINTDGWKAGIYVLSLYANQSMLTFKCVKN